MNQQQFEYATRIERKYRLISKNIRGSWRRIDALIESRDPGRLHNLSHHETRANCVEQLRGARYPPQHRFLQNVPYLTALRLLQFAVYSSSSSGRSRYRGVCCKPCVNSNKRDAIKCDTILQEFVLRGISYCSGINGVGDGGGEGGAVRAAADRGGGGVVGILMTPDKSVAQ